MSAEFTVTCLKVQLQRRPFNECQINGEVKITLKLISEEEAAWISQFLEKRSTIKGQ